MDDLWCPSSVRGGSFSFSLASPAALRHGQDFSAEGSDIAADSGQRRTLTWLTADCAPTLESGHTGASDGGRGDVWRTEAAGTQPRTGHWLQWLPGTSTGTTAADPDSRNPAWALLLLLQVQSHFTAAAARQQGSQAVW